MCPALLPAVCISYGTAALLLKMQQHISHAIQMDGLIHFAARSSIRALDHEFKY